MACDGFSPMLLLKLASLELVNIRCPAPDFSPFLVVQKQDVLRKSKITFFNGSSEDFLSNDISLILGN